MHAERRAAFLERIGSGVAVFPSAPTTIRNNDVENDYRQDSDLYYFTGFDEPESLLVLTNVHDEHRAVLFVRPRDPEREVWDGLRAGVDGALAACGVDAVFPIAEVDDKLPDYLKNAPRLHCALGRDPSFDARIFGALRAVRKKMRTGAGTPGELIDPALSVHEMRLRKDAAELEAMGRAIAITAEAHARAMVAAVPGAHENQVEGEILRVFYDRGSPRCAYGTIVASGPNATILHHRRNDRLIEDGDLLLIDAGCEYEYLASDVTRTFPANGKFSPDQRGVYDIVLASQVAAIEAVRPGATADEVHEGTVRILAQGMIDLGLVEGDLDTVIDEELYKPFYMHRTSHWLGMDVHDVGRYYIEQKARLLEPGFVLTIEPGMYIAKDAKVPRGAERFRGIGIRIEDDVLVTSDGRQNLTAQIPKDPDELERLIAAGRS